MPAVKSVGWCFTIFWDGNRPELLFVFDNSFVSFAIWQHEKALSTGRDHLQGYIQCKGQRTLNQVRSLFGTLNPHLEKQRAPTPEEAINYCCKEETRFEGPWTYGEFFLKDHTGDDTVIWFVVRRKECQRRIPLFFDV